MARFCAACGARLARRRLEGRARLACPRCGVVVYGNPVPAAVAIITRAGRVLLGRRARAPHAGTWDLAGGFLEAGETPLRGLRRELREELGVTIRRARLLGFVTDRYGPRGFPVLTAIYHVVLPSGACHPADDVTELRWFPRARLPYRQIAFASMRRALRDFVGAKGTRRRVRDS